MGLSDASSKAKPMGAGPGSSKRTLYVVQPQRSPVATASKALNFRRIGSYASRPYRSSFNPRGLSTVRPLWGLDSKLGSPSRWMLPSMRSRMLSVSTDSTVRLISPSFRSPSFQPVRLTASRVDELIQGETPREKIRCAPGLAGHDIPGHERPGLLFGEPREVDVVPWDRRRQNSLGRSRTVTLSTRPFSG